MTEDLHRSGVREANLVVRHLKLVDLTPENRKGIVDEVDHRYGIDTVNLDEKSDVLNVAYDATHCDLNGIEEIIRSHGAEVSHDWWTRFKEGYYRNVDVNVKERSKIEPWSCHGPLRK